MAYIKHSAKGTTWGKHKYIAIKNGRYIYPDDSNTSTWDNEKNVSTWDNGKNVKRWEDVEPKNVPDEYRKALESNSRKNVYFGRGRGGYSDEDTHTLRNKNSSGVSKINKRDYERIMNDRDAKRVYNEERDYGRQETEFEKKWQNDPNFRRTIGDRAYNKTHDLDRHAGVAKADRRRNGVIVKNARDEGRKAVQAHKKVEEKKAAINRATKNMERYARNEGRKATQEYKKAQNKKSAADRVSSTLRNVKTSAKSTVNKGRSAVSSLLSRFTKRG